MGLQHQHPVEPADRGIVPEAAAQLIEPFPFGGGLALEPPLQQGILRGTAEQVGAIQGRFGGGGELGGPALLQPLPPLPFPAEVTRLPEHLALQRTR